METLRTIALLVIVVLTLAMIKTMREQNDLLHKQNQHIETLYDNYYMLKKDSTDVHITLPFDSTITYRERIY
jgi:hypothetical protein